MALVTSSSASSSNTSPSQFSYHVFLSFRGEDTRKSFTDHLYTALTSAGFCTFRDDDELQRGEDIKPELQKAVQHSRSSVIVFSENYASSGWCLNELVMILQCKTTSNHNHVVLPVFYGIDPSHLRKQTGSLAKAFTRHGKKQSLEKLNKWREALSQVADLAGMVLQNQDDGHESKFIRKIVKVIDGKLSRMPLSVTVTPYLVGIQDQVRKINLWLQDGSSDVGILGIYGMGGTGKTTIAQVVYNSNFQRFEASSFLENIREISEQHNGLVQLQRKLISDISNGWEVTIHGVSEGIIKIMDAVSSKKILLVLDDVDRTSQLDAILRMRDSFCPGSKIIVTTRDAGLLRGLHHADEVYALNEDESLKLFSWHAFRQDHPVEAYMELSERMVHHSGGLPLALQTLGSSLSGQSIYVWESALKKLKAIPNSEVFSKLRISYDSLQDGHDQNLFLHIACFFIGKDKDVIVKILDECDFYTVVGIQNLIDRCLVTIDIANRLKMHQMIRDMGREIVRQESKEPGKRSRLWHHKDSLHTLRENNGSEAIEGLSLNMNMYHVSSTRNSDEVVLETTAFTSMRQLKLLELCDVQLNGSYQEFPKGLRWLCWSEYPLHSIPDDFVLENLVVLEMHYSSNLKLVWKGTKHLPSLKTLDLSHSHGLTETGDFSLVPNLERLILVDCASLVAIHESIGKLGKLVYLNMTDCKVIRKLPDNITMLKFLEVIIISGCSNLNEFPMEMSKMESLKVLRADSVPINQLLIIATATGTGPGKSLKNYWTCLPSTLVDLSLTNCNLSDDDFPRDFGNVSSLKKLDLGGNGICSLPDCVRGLKGLDYLGIGRCTSLKSLIRLPRVRRLEMYFCKSLEKVTFQSFSCLPKFMNSDYSPIVEMEHWYKLKAIGRVDIEMFNLLGLCNLEPIRMEPITMKTPSSERTMEIQGLHECGIFSTFFPGTVNEVPGEFSHSSSGDSSISFTVPLLSNHRIRGLNIYCVYAKDSSGIEWLTTRPVIIVVRNKSKGLKWIYWPSCFGVPSKKQDLIWLSHWKFRNQLEAGDHVTASVHWIRSYEVKEWGIRIVHEEEDKMSRQLYNSYRRDDNCYDGQDPDNDVNEEMIGIGGDLSELYDLYQEKPGTYLFGNGPLKEFMGFYRRHYTSRILYMIGELKILFMIEESDEETDEEAGSEQAEPDRMLEAAEAEQRGGISKYGGWRGRGCKFLIMAAVFFFSVSLFSQKRKRQPTSCFDGVTSDMTEEYMNWVQTDSAIMSLLAATLSSAALSCVVGSKNSWEVWKILRERYGVSRSTAMQLKTNLYTIQKGTDTIDKYFERIKGITDQLATVGINIPDEEIIFIAANGLPSEYKVIKFMIKAQITSMSMNELRSFLLDEESIVDQPAKPIQVPHIATMVSGSDPCHYSTYTSSPGYVVNSLPATTYMVNTAENNGVTTHVGYIHPLSQYSGYTQQNVNTCISQPTGFMAQNDGGIQLHSGRSQQQQHDIYPQNNGSSKFNNGFTSQMNSGYSLHNTRHPQGNYSQNNAGYSLNYGNFSSKGPCYSEDTNNSSHTNFPCRSFNKSNRNQNGRYNPRLRYNNNGNQNFGGSIVCQICEKPGHGAYRCYYRNNDALQYQICKKSGHTTKNCRQACQSMELWRSLPLFPPG